MRFITFLSLILIGMGSAFSCSSAPAAEEPDFIASYFNDPGAARHTIANPSFDEHLIQLIDAAKQKIHFSFYGFSHRGIADAIVRAVKRGLEVEFTGDHRYYSSGNYGYDAFEELLPYYPRTRMTVGNSQSIMHNKWLIADDLYVMTGTGNITNSGTTQNDNAWVIIRNRDLAADFEREHQQMINGRFGHAKLRTDNNVLFHVNGTTPVENYFSPQEDGMARYVQAVEDAKSNVFFMIFAFTHDDLGRSLVNKHKEFVRKNQRANIGKSDQERIPVGFRVREDGVPIGVQGIMDRSQFTHAQHVEVYRLAGACGGRDLPVSGGIDILNTRCPYPLDFRRDGNENTAIPGDWQGGGGRLHSKIILIDVGTDRAKVLVGSFNWSDNANENNDENLVIIHSKSVVDLFYEQYKSLYAIAKELPGKRAEYQDIIISEVNWVGSRVEIDSKFYDYDGNEFVELYNPNDEAVDISYWSLRFPINDSYTDPGISFTRFPPWRSARKKSVIGFPEGTKIPPKGFFVVYEPDLRNDNKNGYIFEAGDLYFADNPSTFAKKVAVYNPYTGLSNFMGLYDRRNSASWRAACRPAWSSHIARFSTSQGWNIYTINRQNGFPFKLGLRIELRDSRGNLVDLAGSGRLAANTNLGRGGFFTTGTPGESAPHASAPNYGCALSDNIHLISMERKEPTNSQWGIGNDWSSWENAEKLGVPQGQSKHSRHKYLGPDFTERTVATPGMPNSRWTTDTP